MTTAKQLSVLLIDDDATLRKILRAKLEAHDFKASEAPNLSEGRRLLREAAPHLVVLDLQLPDGNGFELLEDLSRDAPGTAVIVLTGAHHPELTHRAISLGAADYVHKPVDFDLLLKKIRKALKQRDFPSVSFGQGLGPKVDLICAASVQKVNEVGFVIQARAKIAEEAVVRLSSPQLERAGCGDVVYRKTPAPAKLSEFGQYYNEVAIIGLTSEQAKSLSWVLRDSR